MTMGDLISRKAAIDIMQAKGDAALGTVKAVFYSAAHMLELLPDADAEPMRHGYWIQAGHDGWSSYIKCSKCKRYLRDIHPSDYKFCPYCGAKMDGDEKSV